MARDAYKKGSVLKSLGTLIKRVGVLHKFLKDPKVPLLKKLMVIGGVIYIISPIDIIADPVLGIGLVDDAVLMIYIISKIADELDTYLIREDKPKDTSIDKEKIIDNVDYRIDDE